MLRYLLPLLCFACSASVAGAARSPREASVPEVWVDESAVAPPDGSVEHPYRSLAEALSKAAGNPVKVSLATGLYRDGPFRLGKGQSLVGHGQVVLSGEDVPAVVQLSEGSALESVTVQGGEVGIDVGGDAKLTSVTLSGQRRTAVKHSHGRLEMERCTLSATLARAEGLVLSGDASVMVHHSRFLGPFIRGLFLDSAHALVLEDSLFEGPVAGVHARGGTVTIRRTQFNGGRGPAIVVGSSRLLVEDVTVTGHEYGLLAREANGLRVRQFRSTRADRAGVSIVKGSDARVEDLLVEESGSYGAVQTVSASVTFERFTLRSPLGFGVNVREGQVTLRRGEIRNVRDDGGGSGDGIHVRQGKVDVRDVTVSEAAGAGVLAAEGADVQLERVTIEKAKWGGVLAETLGKIRVSGLTTRGCPSAIVVPGEGTVEADGVTASEIQETAIWAECGQGAKVSVRRLKVSPPAKARPSACVELKSSP